MVDYMRKTVEFPLDKCVSILHAKYVFRIVVHTEKKNFEKALNFSAETYSAKDRQRRRKMGRGRKNGKGTSIV